MEKLRNRVGIKIVRSEEMDKIRRLVASPLYSRHVTYTNDLVGIDMRKSKLFLKKKKKNRLHRDDDPRQQQDPDVRPFLQQAEKAIRPKVRALVHRH